MVRREDLGRCADEGQFLSFRSPGDVFGRIGNLGHAPRAGGRADVDVRTDVRVPDLGRLRHDGDSHSVRRPGQGVDILKSGAPPASVGAVGVDDIEASLVVRHHGARSRERIGGTGIGQEGETPSVRRDPCPFYSGIERDDDRGFSRLQGHDGQLVPAVDGHRAVKRGAVFHEAGRREVLGKSQQAFLRAVGGDCVPFVPAKPFRAAGTHLVEDRFAVRRDGHGLRQAQGGPVRGGEGVLIPGLNENCGQADGEYENRETKETSVHEFLLDGSYVFT